MGKRSEHDVEKERFEDIAWVMSGAKGRRFMWWLLGETGLYESAFRQPSPMIRPEERVIYNGAKRELGLMLQSELRRVCPAEFDTMGLEARLQKALEKGPAPQKARAHEEEAE
jgi:hypothetical protein